MIRTTENITDIGSEDFIRDLREVWIKYTSPLYLDLIDTNKVPTKKDNVIQTVSGREIRIPKNVP